MGWNRKQRGDRGGYYSRSVRVNGWVVKKYVGNGPLAELEAVLDHKRRAVHAADKAAVATERSQLAALDLSTSDPCKQGRLLMVAVLIAAGFYIHHGEVRRRRTMPTTKMPGPAVTKVKVAARPKTEPPSRPVGDLPAEDVVARLRYTVDRANAGDAEALACLRAFLDRNPSLWRQAGDATAAAEAAWEKKLGGTDALAFESLKRAVAELKANLKGPNPTPLEGLLADHVALTWMAVLHAESQAAAPNTAGIPAEVLLFKRAESAQKRFMTAMKTLATMRQLTPAGLVPAQPLKLHQPVRATG